MESESTFSLNLKTLREEAGMTQQQLSEALGFGSRGSISFYENGSRQPNIELLTAVAKYFNVSADWLLGLSNVKTPDKSIRAACESTGLSEGAVSVIKTASDMADHQQAEIPPVLDMFLSESQQLIWTLVQLTNMGYLIATKEVGWKDIFPEDYADTMKAQAGAVNALWNRYNPMIAVTPEEQLDTLRAKATRQFESIVDKISDAAINKTLEMLTGIKNAPGAATPETKSDQ